jgi:hypothetical protein
VRRLHTWAVFLCALSPVAAVAAGAAPASVPEKTADDIDERTRALERRVDELRESVSRTRARLAALQEMVVGGDLGAGARVQVVHRNEMGGSYVLESAAFALDGATVFARVDAGGDLDRQAQLEVFAGRVAPGPHQLAARLVYRARGSGLAGARAGDRVEVRSSFAFEAARGVATAVRTTGFEKGGAGARLDERAALRFESDARPEAPRAPPAAPATGGAAR